MKNFLSIVLYFLISFLLVEFSNAADTISLSQSIVVGETLVSSGESFVLGFFSPGESKNRHVGIWYKKFPNIYVWVANRETIADAYAALTITNNGNLVILNQKNKTIWSSNSSGFVSNPVAQLLESGNFVVRDASAVNSGRYVWQSFDLPTDTLLPGMKIGRDSNTGMINYLTSWKNSSDPSPGNFTYRLDNFGLPQFVLREGSVKKFRTGHWNGERFSGFSSLISKIFKPRFVYNTEDLYYTYEVTDNSVTTRFMLDELGLLKRLVLNANAAEWAAMYTVQSNPCDDYGHCGANGICRPGNRPICECLKGFVSKSQKEWEVLNWTSGCVRRLPLDCQKGEGFVKLANVKLPDLVEFWVNKSMSLKECKAECSKNCSCTAYTNSNISKGGSGCLMWFRDLVDIREFIEEDSEQDIYLRVSASELDLMGDSSQKAKRLVIIIVVVSTISGLLILILACWFIIRKKRRKKRVFEKEDLQLPLFDLVTIAHATKNFSCENRIGEGGFGPVYKGQLLIGQIAVKRLSKNSGQGVEEFKNEVILIAKLQHRNLVRLLGCCIERDERILIYEYMPNKSLDCFIFDQTRRALLDWPKRFDIVMGIASGLLYLHQDSRLRVIHRDLKGSNILLDSELNPKISDFGIARMFGGDHIEAKTKHVIGTYGYMSPEYAIDGKFSVKSDVFSLGVILLEIVSGKRNTKFCHPDHYHNLLGHAWLLWNEDKASELIDPCLKNSCVESQVQRCIQVGLLCVQKLPRDRPAMSSVFLMLSSEGATLPQPKQPGFFADRSFTDADISTSEVGCCTKNEVTITVLDGR